MIAGTHIAFASALYLGGYWSHLWIDMLNLRGADLLWPSPVRVVMPGNRDYRMAVGSKAEMVLMTVLLAVLNWLSHYQDWIRILPPVSQILQWPADQNAQFGQQRLLPIRAER